MSEDIPEPLDWLKHELLRIEASVTGGAISDAIAEYAAVMGVRRALVALDPRLLDDGALRRLDVILSRNRTSQARAERSAGKRQRPPIDDDIAMMRCGEIAALEWLKELRVSSSDRTRLVLRCLNSDKRVTARTGRKVTTKELENWRHKWLPAQPLLEHQLKSGSAVWAYSHLVAGMKRSLRERQKASGEQESPAEVVFEALSAICNHLAPAPPEN